MLNGAKGRDILLGQSGVGVASRALVCGTILSVTSFAATVWLTYKLTGVNNVSMVALKYENLSLHESYGDRHYQPGFPEEKTWLLDW